MRAIRNEMYEVAWALRADQRRRDRSRLLIATSSELRDSRLLRRCSRSRALRVEHGLAGLAGLVFVSFALSACGSTAPLRSTSHAPIVPPRMIPPPEPHRPRTPAPVAVEVENPVTRGELPWWHELKDGIYKYGEEVIVLGVGQSANHHHVAEGFLASKVNARLGVRKAAERIRFTGTIPEPTMLDLFITRERKFLALYSIRVPKDAGLPAALSSVSPPEMLRMHGRRRVGRHIYEGDRHLYLECDVEGPIANPDWGRTRASARH